MMFAGKVRTFTRYPLYIQSRQSRVLQLIVKETRPIVTRALVCSFWCWIVPLTYAFLNYDHFRISFWENVISGLRDHHAIYCIHA